MRSRRGTTMVELLIALTITALVALGVATVLQAASYGTSTRRDIRKLAVRSQQVRNRIDDAIRSARAVLAGGTDISGNKYIVLWRGDSNTTDANKVNASELQMLEWNVAASTLNSYAAATTPVPDTVYAVNADFHAAAHTLPATIWANKISSFVVALDKAAPSTQLVTWSLTVTSDLVSESFTNAAALREWGLPQ